MNYYELLQVPLHADISQIKRAYRRLVLKVHPDKAVISPEVFQKITEAYNTLSDPEKRRKYDQKILLDSGEIFCLRRSGTDLKVTLKVKIDEMLKGIEKTIVTERRGWCRHCNGTGSERKVLKLCPSCNGSRVDGYSKLIGLEKPCQRCQGAGKIPDGDLCISCHGTGLEPELIRQIIKLSQKCLSDKRIVIKGLGNCCLNGCPGNLIVELDYDNDPGIKVLGRDLEKEIEISPAQAVLGDKIAVDIYGRKEIIVIPSGISEGHVVKKKNAGLSFDNKTGSLYVKIHVRIPQNISEEQRKIYQQLLIQEKKDVGGKGATR